MNKLYLFIIILFFLVLGFVAGFIFVIYIDQKQMEGYDLYNCVYNNAARNDFGKHPVLIRAIQDECVCFREHNYTNLSEVNCSR